MPSDETHLQNPSPTPTRHPGTADVFADEDAFRALVERASRRLFRVAYRITGDEATAEDVVQDTFLRAYRSRDRFAGAARPETWLHRIAVNLALDEVRRHSRSGDALPRAEELEPGTLELAVSHDPGPHRHAASRQLGSRVGAALDELTAMERTAFTGRHLEDRSIAELSDELGVGRNAGKQAVFRAVGKLRKALESWTQPPEHGEEGRR